MAACASDPTTLTLHAVRLLGFADTGGVARRFHQAEQATHERLLDAEALGLVTRSRFADQAGWSLTDRGRVEDERRLADELEGAGLRPMATDVHARFVPLNARLQDAATRWQVRPTHNDPLAGNDHTDHRWDDRVIESLRSVGHGLRPLDAELASALDRFAGYAARFDQALTRVDRGEGRWIDGLGIDSCHVVWMQLHEDLLATLGLARGHTT